MTPEEKRAYQREYMRKWRKKNPRTPTAEDREKSRVRWRAWKAAHPGHRTPFDPTYRFRHPWVRSISPRRADAKKRGIPFTLKVADVKAVWTGRCAVTGLEFKMEKTGRKGPQPFSPSLDRIVPGLGYVPGNVRFILHCVNSFKGTMTDEQMAWVAGHIKAV